MSIEYTIDIQLTELGFPEVLQSQETSVRDTPCPIDPFSPCHSPSSLSAEHKQKPLVESQQSVEGSPLHPAHSLQQADSDTACPELTDGDAAQKNSAQHQKDVEDDSDDSEVSLYEEDEFDEEEEEEDEGEERPNNGMIYSLLLL